MWGRWGGSGNLWSIVLMRWGRDSQDSGCCFFSSFPSSGAVVGFRRLSFSFWFFCLTNCVSVSVSFTFFPVECVSGGVVKGVVKVEQDRWDEEETRKIQVAASFLLFLLSEKCEVALNEGLARFRLLILFFLSSFFFCARRHLIQSDDNSFDLSLCNSIIWMCWYFLWWEIWVFSYAVYLSVPRSSLVCLPGAAVWERNADSSLHHETLERTEVYPPTTLFGK